jgi:hypothetical protein
MRSFTRSMFPDMTAKYEGGSPLPSTAFKDDFAFNRALAIPRVSMLVWAKPIMKKQRMARIATL